MTLLAPLFLAGLVAIGLPLWLHRLSSDNPNRQPFSSLMFLEAGEPRRVLARKLQYLLLLALRIAVLALLAVAFAQPALWRSAQATSGAGARLHLIVLDTSASMAAGDRWSRAQAAAGDVIDSLAADDRGQIIAAGRVIELATAATLDRAELRQALPAIEPGVFHIDFGQLMTTLDGVIRGADLPVVAHVITDAQESALPVRFAELAPREPVELTIHNVGGDEANVAIESLVGSALNGELTATVRSFAEVPVTRSLRLELNGSSVEQQTVTLEPGQRVQASFAPLALAAGSNRVRAALTPADDLAGDDSRIIALKRPEPRPVLLVSGDIRGGRDTLYVAAALRTLEALALEPVTVDDAGLADENLDEYAFVVVADAAAIGAGATAELMRYIDAGGAVLLALGPRSTGLTEVPITGELFDAGGVPPARAADYYSIGTLDASHPALRGLDTLRAAKFFRYSAIVPSADDRVLASLESGAPLLLERTIGNGRVLVLASSLDREWSDLPVQPVFVPFMAGIANHLLGGAGFSNEAALGSTLALRAMGLSGGQIFDPSGEAALALGAGTDDVLLDQVGFYELVGGGNSELVAVNFDARESDLETLDDATIARWEELGQSSEAASAGASTDGGGARLAPLGYWILFLVLAVIGMESWVGNWHLRVRRGLAA
jgi:Aerotolerance regulator N-terminal/von Willebrand factor type A domain